MAQGLNPKNGVRTKYYRTKCHTVKMSQNKMSQDKMSHQQNVTGQNVTRTKCHRTKCHMVSLSPSKFFIFSIMVNFASVKIMPSLIEVPINLWCARNWNIEAMLIESLVERPLRLSYVLDQAFPTCT